VVQVLHLSNTQLEKLVILAVWIHY